MKRFFVAAGLAFAAAGTSCAQSEKEPGFIPLFDGKTLSGWRSTTENPDSFKVKGGTLIVDGDRAHLFYDGAVEGARFDDFELRLEVKTTKGSNSGVYFHTQYQAEGWPDIGFEAQVNSSASDPRKTGSLYAVADIYVPGEDEADFAVRHLADGNIQVARETAPSTDGKWFDYTIRVEGERVQIWVDGVMQVDWTQPATWSREGRIIGTGTFALQAHDPDSVIHYRNIRVMPLNTAPTE